MNINFSALAALSLLALGCANEAPLESSSSSRAEDERQASVDNGEKGTLVFESNQQREQLPNREDETEVPAASPDEKETDTSETQPKDASITDLFDQESLADRWNVLDGVIGVVDGRAAHVEGGVSDQAATVMADQSFSDLEVMIEAAPSGAESLDFMGIMLRYNGDYHSHDAYMLARNWNSGIMTLFRRTEEDSMVRIRNAAVTQEVWKPTIRIVGGTITVTIDGATVIEYSDPDPLPAGTVGFYLRPGNSVESFTIKRLD